MSLQLYQVDQKSYLLDFKSLSCTTDGQEQSADGESPPSGRSISDTSLDGSDVFFADEKMEVDDSGYPKVHQTLEFFEMCANLITALAR
ncbi:5'-AMP-activated protein kinase catalytic subunit alpha-2-like [Liolophura sinensis]|uniref:5'-AMP-activated protein kinase catalytic subunit alpha-2-like n=1 Tax=Liolophura sinensis TaxID=3198878 RepID=UPI003158655E